MSHSQFRRIILILTHAWLNLWDKHMTTGRINQVSLEFSERFTLLLSCSSGAQFKSRSQWKAPVQLDQHCSHTTRSLRLSFKYLTSYLQRCSEDKLQGSPYQRSARLRGGLLSLGFSTQAAASSWTEFANIQSPKLQTHCSVNSLFRH